jgi:poly-gamma-glutamate capsule biosynthesis protein CapA/YwtB (metallophosphatase superfamily)
VIHGTGDVNLDSHYIPNLETRGYPYAWSGLAGLFKRDDLTVINLECAVSRLGSPVDKEFTFRADPESLPATRNAGVEVANLGNNHSGDYGPEALLDSRRNLLRHDILPVGVGRDEDQAHEPAIYEVNGWTVAVLGFGGVVPTPDWIAGPNHPGMADGDDISSMVEAVNAADEVADLVIVAIHWGVELDTKPRPEDIERAFAMIDAGADVIFGGHSHRLQPMGRYKGRPIFWSLGNFVWPNFSVDGSTTAVAEVTVTPKGKVTGRLIPAFIQSSGHPVLTGS